MVNDKINSRKPSKPIPNSATAGTPTKRPQRNRNNVQLMQNDYFKMYSNENNRGEKRKKGSVKDSSPSPSVKSNESNGNTKKRKVEKKSRSSSPPPSPTASKSIYRWVGPSISPPPPTPTATTTTTTTSSKTSNKKDDEDKSKNKYYQKLEINVGNHPALVGVGDFVLISSADYEEDDLIDKTNEKVRSLVNIESRSAAVQNMVGGNSEDDEDEVLNSTLKSEEKMEVAMNSLDPYVGRIEDMWEESEGASKGNKEDDKISRMKFRVRWFFKRGDVLLLRGQFVGASRQQLAKSLSPRDILLGEQTDINEVSTILGKCRVRRLKPLTENESTSPSMKNEQDDGAFFCRYDIGIDPPAKSSGKGKIRITPFEGPDEEEEIESAEELVSKRSSTESNASQSTTIEPEEGAPGSDIDSLEAGEPVDNISKSAEVGDDDDSSMSIADRRSRKQPPITEGNATLKIKVGIEHQAEIPPQINKRKYTPNRASPLTVWKPLEITDIKLNSYFQDAGNILKEYMKKNGMAMTRSLPHNVPPSISSLDPSVRSSSHCVYREFNVDDLLFLLHDHNYNTISALKGLKNYPEEYLFLWTKEDKELYNIGFQKHASNLHYISKNITETKNHKDVVDYHYRFKIPDQFKRFQDLKREQARRMLEAGERLRLNEYLSESGNGAKRSQQWSRTGGGGPNEIGEVEARRLECKSFLFKVREAVGEDQYLTLVNLLKSLNSKVLTIPQMKDGFASILQKHPQLLGQFETYLPAMFRD